MKTEQPAPAATTFNTVKEVEANLKARMDKAVSDLQHDMATIRTGRASLGILDHIRVDYYGTPTPLNQIANLHVPTIWPPSAPAALPWAFWITSAWITTEPPRRSIRLTTCTC